MLVKALEDTPYIRRAARIVLATLTPEQIAEMQAAIAKRKKQQARVKTTYQLELWKVHNGRQID